MKYRVKSFVIDTDKHMIALVTGGAATPAEDEKITALRNLLFTKLEPMHDPKDCPMAKHLHEANRGTPLCPLCEGSKD